MTRPCPTRDDLARLLADDVDERTRQRLETHVGECTTCQRQLLEVAGEIRTLPEPAETATSPPAPFLESLKQIARREAPTPPADETKKLFIPDFEIMDELGRGGTAVIYKARQLSLKRVVALKVIPTDLVAPDTLRRNRRGVEALAGLSHPGIVQIYEIGLHERYAFGALELMEGGSLKRQLQTRPYTATDAARVLKAIAEAVDFMHQNGIVHRDLKTSNILLTAAGVPKIADFGLAKRTDALDDVTQVGDIMGTPAYMSPEQAVGGPAGVATDIYSLGAILYDLLTGHPPFRGSTALDTIEQVIHLPPKPPSHEQPGTPRDLELICLKCLRKDPEDRYATAQDLANDLGHFLQGEPIVARLVPTTERVSKWLRRRPDLAALLALLAFVATVSIVALLIEREQLHRALGDEERLRRHDSAALDAVRLALARQALAAGDFAAARAALDAIRPESRTADWQELRAKIRSD